MKYGLHGKPYAYFTFFGRYKEVYERGGLLISLEEACCKCKIVYISFKDMEFSSWRANLHPMFLILILNQFLKPWEGLWCVVMIIYDMCLVSTSLVGCLLEA